MGALSVRLPDSLHEQVSSIAKCEGISMSQFVMLAVAEKVTRLDASAQSVYLEVLRNLGREIAAEQGVSLKEAAREVLDKASDREPLEEDRLPADVE